MQTLNKGEWSEAYCLFSTIAAAQLTLCDGDLRDLGQTIPVYGGLIGTSTIFKIEGTDIIFGEQAIRIPITEIAALSTKTLNAIQTSIHKTFAIPEIDAFLLSIGASVSKAPAHQKSDMTLTVYDALTKSEETLDFSIKSFLAGRPTLINASRATNFEYDVDLRTDDASTYQTMRGKKLLRAMRHANVSVCFKAMQSDIYHRNLMLVDSGMPSIVASLLLEYFSASKKQSKIIDLLYDLEQTNPLKWEDRSLYRHKIADFLFYSATGLFPNRIWAGKQEIDGGCVIVDKKGKIYCFYVFRKEFLEYFREYLLDHCFLDTASITRHNFGTLQSKGNKHSIVLNLQVRIRP